MQKELLHIMCPICFHHMYIPKDKIILASIEKDIKTSISNDEYFKQKCDKCGHYVKFLYPFIYFDANKSFELFLSYDEVILDVNKEAKNKRIVKSIEELNEKIRIFEADLDDRRIELLKYRLCKQLGSDTVAIQVEFISYDKDYIVFRIDDEYNNLKLIDSSVYNNIAEYESSSSILEINMNWAKEELNDE
ncbi:MAG: CpXC domain-containing protein [Erysipelotrichaceae bacterium]